MKFFDVLWIVPMALLGSGLPIALWVLKQQEKQEQKPDLAQKRGTDIVPISDHQPPTSLSASVTTDAPAIECPPDSIAAEPLIETNPTVQELTVQELTVAEAGTATSVEKTTNEEATSPIAPEVELNAEAEPELLAPELRVVEPNLTQTSAATELIAEASASENALADDITTQSWTDALPDAAVDAITQANLTTIALYSDDADALAEGAKVEALDQPSASFVEVVSEAELDITSEEPVLPEESAPEEMPALEDANPNSSDAFAPQPESPPNPETPGSDQVTSLADAPSAEATPAPVSLPPIIPLADPRSDLDVGAFKQAFIANLLQVRGKSLQTSTPVDQYTVLALMVRARLLLAEPEAQQVVPQARIVGQIATEFRVTPQLETHLLNLGVVAPIYQGLQELELRLAVLYDQEAEPAQFEPDLSEWTGSYLESLTTANLPAIGYGICYADSPSGSSHPDLVQEAPTEVADQNPWMIQRPELQFEVKFGGYTDSYADPQGHYRKRWLTQETVACIACDILISGFDARTVNILRLWQGASPESNALLCPPPLTRQNEEIRLKRCFLLVSCSVQDMIRLHLASGATIETLPERWALQLSDTPPVLAIAELMYWLVDEYKLDWDQSWEITQGTFSCTLYSVMPDAVGERWTIGMLSRLLPRHLEILYEINRRFLDSVWRADPSNEAKIPQLSLIEEVGDQYFRHRYLRTTHLAYIGCHRISGANSFHTQMIQRILPAFSELYPDRLHHRVSGITPRRFLLQSNPRLTNLITEWIGDQWMTDPTQLSQLEPLVNNAEFCGQWWQVKRDNKQSLADRIQQSTGIVVNLNSLFEVQAMPIGEAQRQLLNLLHVITLYARIKINASTDTMQRFAHRSMPRTVIFAGQPQPRSKFAASIAQLIQFVSNTINGDADVQGRLQVVYLPDESFQLVRRLYAAADIGVYIPLAGQVPPSTLPLRFAFNGALISGTPDSTIAELRQAVGAKNQFLFGMTTTEVNNLKLNYTPMQHYSADPELQQVIKLIASGHFSYGDEDTFRALGNWLLTEDPQLTLAEYPAYINSQERLSQAYQDQKNWTWMSILSVAHMGQLSADRAVADERKSYS